MTTVDWPTRDQVRAALEGAIEDDSLPAGWRRVLVHLLHEIDLLLGITPCVEMLTDNHDVLAGEAEPGLHNRAPGIHFGVSESCRAVEALWRRHVYRYARTAQAALQAVADSTTPDFARPLSGEHEPPSPHADGHPVAPEVGVPAQLASRDGLQLIHLGLGQLGRAEDAAEEERELGEYEDEETGELRHCIPEHQLATSQELLAEADRWDQYLGEYADVVAYVLVTTLREHLTAPAATASTR